MSRFLLKNKKNNKVLPPERKRHAARRVASAHYDDLSPDRKGGGGRYPIQSLMGGRPDLGWGTPPSLDGATPCPDLG